MAFGKNTQVRLQLDPSRVGTCTGKTKVFDGCVHYLVHLPGEPGP